MRGLDFNHKCFLYEEVITEEFRKKLERLPNVRHNCVVKVLLPDKTNTILNASKKQEAVWDQENTGPH